MMPAWAIPLSIWFLRERVTGAKLAGLVMGLGALALLLGEGFAALGAAPLGSIVPEPAVIGLVGLLAKLMGRRRACLYNRRPL